MFTKKPLVIVVILVNLLFALEAISGPKLNRAPQSINSCKKFFLTSPQEAFFNARYPLFDRAMKQIAITYSSYLTVNINNFLQAPLKLLSVGLRGEYDFFNDLALKKVNSDTVLFIKSLGRLSNEDVKLLDENFSGHIDEFVGMLKIAATKPLSYETAKEVGHDSMFEISTMMDIIGVEKVIQLHNSIKNNELSAQSISDYISNFKYLLTPELKDKILKNIFESPFQGKAQSHKSPYKHGNHFNFPYPSILKHLTADHLLLFKNNPQEYQNFVSSLQKNIEKRIPIDGSWYNSIKDKNRMSYYDRIVRKAFAETTSGE